MMQHIRIMETRNIDELIILDVNATIYKKKPSFDEIKEFTKELFCPVTIGGGITNLDDIGKLIQECGADKVSLQSIIFDDATIIKKAATKYGSQAITVALDVWGTSQNYKITRKGATFWISTDLVEYAKFLEQEGAGEILLTSVNNNGTFKGYDTEILEKVSDAVDIPVVINGGCGKPLDMVGAIACGASAVAASSLFLFTEHTPRSCAKALQEAGIPVRLR